MNRGQGRVVRGTRGVLALAILALALLTPPGSAAARPYVVAHGGARSAWGDNPGGALGDGTFFARDEPVHVTST